MLKANHNIAPNLKLLRYDQLASVHGGSER